MPSPLSPLDLFLLPHHEVLPQEVGKIEHALPSCTNCAASLASENDSAPTIVTKLSSRSAVPSLEESPAEESACLALGYFGMFILDELKEPERLQVEKHCALCEPCREQLVEVFRALIMPMDAEERTRSVHFPLSMDAQQNFPCVV